MGRKADKKELKAQEEAIKELGYDNLPYYNVEDRIVETVQNDNSRLENKKVGEFLDNYNKIKASYDFNKAVLKAALTKKCVGEWSKSLRFDEDVSLFSNYIYGKTTFSGKETGIESFDDKNNYKWKIVYQGHSYQGDTMNSWSTTLNEFIRVFGADFIHGYCEREKPEGYKDKDWEHFLSKPENYKKSLPWYIIEFMDVVYTIGNFIPVPCGCNGPRGVGKTKDYWDLALDCIYEWYFTEDKKFLEELLSGVRGDKGYPETRDKKLQEVVELYANWLESFSENKEYPRGQDGWNNFVEKTFMSPFVEQNEKGFGRPRELWDGHFIQRYKKPKNEAQFEQFFVNAKVRILARGKLIAKELF